MNSMDINPQIHEIFLGRQPILDRKQELVGYELLFRSGDHLDADVSDGLAATAHVVVNAFDEMGMGEVLGNQLAYINVNADFLMSDVVHLLPKSQVVLEILESVEIDSDVLMRAAELSQLGFRLALDDVTEITPAMRAILPLISVVKIDFPQVEAARLAALVGALRAACPAALLLAEKVESHAQLASCQSLGFDLFQGYYFAKPQVIVGKRPDPAKLGLLRLLSLVLGEAEVEAFEQEFKHYPTLAYGLLRLVNSVACGLSRKVGSLRQAVVVLGRRQLQRWVQLLLYTLDGKEGKASSPLMQLAATRGKLMETMSLVLRPNDRESHERAFMTGILSLLDTLMGIPLPEIVTHLNLPEEVALALLARRGELGAMLALCVKLEEDDWLAVSTLLAGMPALSLQEVSAAQMQAIKWANSFSEDRG